jgi:hypothetical protein
MTPSLSTYKGIAMIAPNNLRWSAIVVFCIASPAISEVNAEQAKEVITAEVPGGGQAVVAKCDAEGTIHLLFDSADGPQYVRSTDNGRSFSKPVEVVEGGLKKSGLRFKAWDLAVGQGGRIHVAMAIRHGGHVHAGAGTKTAKVKRSEQEEGVFYARLEPGTNAFTPAQNINRKPSEGFSLAADERGNVTVCWLSGKLYSNVSHDNGVSFATAVEIDAEFNPCDCCTTSCAYGADGRLAVLYREETNDDRDMYLVLWDQSANKVSRARVSTTSWKIAGCPMSYYTVIAQRGGFMAVWPTKGEIYFGKLDGQGALLPPGEIKTPGTTGMRTGMLTLTDAVGNTLVAWKKNGELGWQIYDIKGQPSGSPSSVKSEGNGSAGVATKDGRFVLFR